MNTIRYYLDDIGQVPLLTKDDEYRLGTTIQAAPKKKQEFFDTYCIEYQDRRKVHNEVSVRPDESNMFSIIGNIALLQYQESVQEVETALVAAETARWDMIQANLRLVFSIATRYQNVSTVELQDLIQEGTRGLEKAVDKFDPEKGFKFSTYAYSWVKQAITRYIDAKGSIIRVPPDTAASIRADLREYDGDTTKLTPVKAQIYTISQHASLDKSVTSDGDVTLQDFIESNEPNPEDEVMRTLQLEFIYEHLGIISPQQRYSICMHFGLNNERAQKSYREIGEDLGITPEAARQLAMKGLERIRSKIKQQEWLD